MYPKFMSKGAAAYFTKWNKLFTERPISTKEARLQEIAASSAMPCEYSIIAQVHMAKAAGISEEEIKAAIQVSAEVSRFSILLYGNEFGQQKLKNILGVE